MRACCYIVSAQAILGMGCDCPMRYAGIMQSALVSLLLSSVSLCSHSLLSGTRSDPARLTSLGENTACTNCSLISLLRWLFFSFHNPLQIQFSLHLHGHCYASPSASMPNNSQHPLSLSPSFVQQSLPSPLCTLCAVYQLLPSHSVFSTLSLRCSRAECVHCLFCQCLVIA